MDVRQLCKSKKIVVKARWSFANGESHNWCQKKWYCVCMW